MHPAIRQVADEHEGLLEWTQLIAAGMSRSAAARLVDQLPRLHDGVWLAGYGTPTREQRWRAATLAAPDSALSHASAAARDGFRPWSGSFEVVCVAGNGGPRRFGDLLVCRSRRLEPWVEVRGGVRQTTPARTLLDLAPALSDRQLEKCVREAIRLKRMTALELLLTVGEHAGRRRRRHLMALAQRLERLPIDRTRSDAEARALVVLDAAGIPAPQVNVRRAGFECDLSWPAAMRLIELDGPQWHQDPELDARKDAAWRAAGWHVDRLPTDAVYFQPHLLVALARPAAGASGQSR